MTSEEKDLREEQAKAAALQILAAVSFDDAGARALRQAFQLLSGHPSACLHLVHVVEGDGGDIERQEEALRVLPAKLERFVARVAQGEGYDLTRLPTWSHVRLGEPVDTIRQVARDYEVDLLVVGTKGRKGISRALLGSVAQSLLSDGRFPVLLAHENKLREISATVFPDAKRAVEPGRDQFASRVYRSTLIDAWRSFGRPTSPFN